jgi:ketopantoate reductase
MRIIVFGAGALGSLLAGLLSRQNEVYMVGRKEHVSAVSSSGLRIEGVTVGEFHPLAGEKLQESPFYPNWIFLTVKFLPYPYINPSSTPYIAKPSIPASTHVQSSIRIYAIHFLRCKTG